MDNLQLYNKIFLLPKDLRDKVEKYLDHLLINKKKTNKKTAKFGSARGMFIMKDDFDEPLNDFKEY